MENKKIVFLGTPAFAACVLEGLINAKYNIVAVVTQPDKEIGRKKILMPTPVKEVALKYNLKVYQPSLLKNDYQFLIDLQPDMLITTAYGQILPQAVLDIAKINNINVHASLLPHLRGGAPIHRSIINGDKVTGVTIMEMVKQMDAGKMYAKAEFVLDDEINTSELFEKLQYIGRDLLLKVLPDLLENKIEGEVQNENEVTYAPNIKREEEKLNFDNSVESINRYIRGLANTPGAYCFYNGKVLKILKASIYQIKEDNVEVGTMQIINKNRLIVKCANGYLELLQVQLEGKKLMNVKDFLNGVNKEEWNNKKLN